MRRFLQIALPVLAICLLVSDAAFAQGQGQRGRGRGGFPGFGGGGGGFMLMNPNVQKELKMTDEQTAKVGEIMRESFQQGGAGGGFQNLQNLSEEERTKFFEDMRKRAEESNKKVLAVLSDDQRARLKQLQLWAGGIAGLINNEEASKELKLTDDQKEALKTITEESQKKTFELFQGFQQLSQDEQAKAREKMGEIRKETETECEAVLTDEQKAKFTKMKGEKPEADLTQGFGFGGRGGGRRGRPNNNN